MLKILFGSTLSNIYTFLLSTNYITIYKMQGCHFLLVDFKFYFAFNMFRYVINISEIFLIILVTMRCFWLISVILLLRFTTINFTSKKNAVTTYILIYNWRNDIFSVHMRSILTIIIRIRATATTFWYHVIIYFWNGIFYIPFRFILPTAPSPVFRTINTATLQLKPIKIRYTLESRTNFSLIIKLSFVQYQPSSRNA